MSGDPNLIQVQPHVRLTKETRDQVTRIAVRRYQAGASVRTIAAELGRSYGFVHRILTEAGVTMRPRGSSNRKKEKT